jgi:hypothetical protein
MSALFQSLSIGGSSREGSGKFAKIMSKIRLLYSESPIEIVWIKACFPC